MKRQPITQRREAHKQEYAEFNQDAQQNGGYLYTTNAQYSSKVAGLRYSQSIWAQTSFSGRTIIDIGSGDGAYTSEFLQFSPASILGIDPAPEAVEVARRRVKGTARIYFSVGSAYDLKPHGQFDIAVLRGVLHHLDRPDLALQQALLVASEVIVLEPNGYNPVLKIIEKVSRYHRAHKERSFSARLLNRWVRAGGGTIVDGEVCCLVPYFCPKPVAKFLKSVEPVFERMPFLRQVSCGAYTFRAVRQHSRERTVAAR